MTGERVGMWLRLVFAAFITFIGVALIIAGTAGDAPWILTLVGVCILGLAGFLVWTAFGSNWVPKVVAEHPVGFGVAGWSVVAAAGATFIAAGVISSDDNSPKALIAGVGLVIAGIWGIKQRVTGDQRPARPGRHERKSY